MRSKFKIRLFRFIPAILWMGFIFYLSSRSTTGIGQTPVDRFLILKTFHVIEYAILAIFLFFGFNNLKMTITIAYIYALSDEFHQSFVTGRMGKFSDTLIDLVGIFIGVLIIKGLTKIDFFNKIFR